MHTRPDRNCDMGTPFLVNRFFLKVESLSDSFIIQFTVEQTVVLILQWRIITVPIIQILL